MTKQSNNNESGFTIIELLIALAVFSGVLILIVTGYVQIMKIYQRGLAGRTTQQSARFIVDDISKSVRSSETIKIASSGSEDYLCLDNIRYIWNSDNSERTLRKEYLTDFECASGTAVPYKTEFLVRDSSDVAVREFVIDPFQPSEPGGTDYRSVEINVLIGTRVEGALYSGNTCNLAAEGVEYCSTTELSTIVSLRTGAGKIWNEYQ